MFEISDGSWAANDRPMRAQLIDELRRAGCKLLSDVAVAAKLEIERRRLTKLGQDCPTCWDDPEFGFCDEVDPLKCTAVCPMARKLGVLGLVSFMAEAIGSDRDDVHLVTLVDPRWLREIGDLASFDVGKAKQVVANRFNKLDARGFVAVGGFEATVNIEMDGSSHWAPHIHLVVAGATAEALHETFMPPDATRRSRSVLRPVWVVQVSGLIGALCYALKGDGGRRTAYLTADGKIGRRDQRLIGEHAVEYAAWQKAHRLEQLLTWHGIRRDGGRMRVVTKNRPAT